MRGGAIEYREPLRRAIAAAEEAAAILLAEIRGREGPAGERGRPSASREAEEALRARLLAAFPRWGFLGTETAPEAPSPAEPHVWLVAADDGAAAMREGLRGGAVSIALLREGEPVLGVVRSLTAPDDGGDLLAWAEGSGPLRRGGEAVERAPWPGRPGPHDVVLVDPGAERHPEGYADAVAPARFRPVASVAWRLALVAAGEAVAAACAGPAGPGAGEYAAGHALLRGVGGRLVDEHGEEIRYGRDGRSRVRRCFGGAPGIAEDLARRDWEAASRGGFGEAAPPPAFLPARLLVEGPRPRTEILRRAQGCWLGQLSGDALGSLVEFQAAASIARAHPDGPRLLTDGGTWDTLAGQPTDDSELALALARTLIATPSGAPYDPEAAAAAYARWAHGWTHGEGPEGCAHPWCRPFDIGNTTWRALGAVRAEDVRAGKAAERARAHASRESQANGALMRVSPLGIWGAGRGRGPEIAAEAARADAELTHPHPACRAASAVFAATLARTIAEGGTPGEVHAFALRWAEEREREAQVIEALRAAGSAPPVLDGANQGWVLLALRNAFHQLLHAPTLEEGVVRTVRAGGDTDTNAAICGALLGAVHGRDALPAQWRAMVLTCRPMPGRGARHPRPAWLWPADALELAERLLG